MKLLVTGASGYVGARLIPRLLADGHEVRAGFTDTGKAANYAWADQVDVVTLDVLDEDQVDGAVGGIDAIYYLVHAMSGEDFARKDRRSAHLMAQAAADAGVERIVYLSGLVPQVPEEELSEHIRSRLEVERLLGSTDVPTLSLRAAVITGSGSTSFEIIRQISERMPVQAIPSWMDSEVQPIALVDVLEALVGALRVSAQTRSYDVGGPDAMPYAELLTVYADVAHIRRPQVNVPGLPSDLVGKLAGLLTDVPSSTVEALIESLHHDMVCHERDFVRDLLPEGYTLMPLRESFVRSLAAASGEGDGVEGGEGAAEPGGEPADPMGPMPHDPTWAGGTGGGVAGAMAGLGAVVSGIGKALSGDTPARKDS